MRLLCLLVPSMFRQSAREGTFVPLHEVTIARFQPPGGPDGPRIAVRLANRIRMSAGLPTGQRCGAASPC